MTVPTSVTPLLLNIRAVEKGSATHMAEELNICRIC